MADQSELTTYRGNCHCADYIYEVKLPELKTVGQCNCSICYKRSALWAVPRPGSVTFVKGNWDALTTYSFNTGTYHHKVRNRELRAEKPQMVDLRYSSARPVVPFS